MEIEIEMSSTSSSAVPFSWEARPGIPKAEPRAPSDPPHALPLPPRLGSRPSILRKKRSTPTDPFAVALVECSKDREAREASSWRSAVKDWLSARVPFDLYGSCRSHWRPVLESTVRVPRTSRAAAAYGLLHRRV